MSPEKMWATINLRRARRGLEPVSLLRVQRILRYMRGHDSAHRSLAFDRRLQVKPGTRWDTPAALAGARLYHNHIKR